jgi:anti-anti-sigma factor
MPVSGGPPFTIEESPEPEGGVRLKLTGELDLSVARVLEARLDALRKARTPATLDLSELEFMDSTGLRVVIVAVTDAQESSWGLAVAPEVSPRVRRLLELVQLDALLWPGAEA